MLDVGVDIGYGNTKVYTKNGWALVSSLVGQLGHDYVSDANRNLEHTHFVKIGKQKYVVGVAAWSIAGACHNYSTEKLVDGSYEARAALYAALSKVLPAKHREGLNISIGLPAYQLKGDEKAKTAEKINKWLLNGDHEWEFNGKSMSAKVESLTLRSQAAGAIGDMIHNLQGAQTKDIEYMNRGVGAISVGMNTLELSGAKKNRPVDTMVASIPNRGVRGLISSINQVTRKGVGEIDEDLRSGEQEIQESVLGDWLSGIVSAIDMQWGDNANSIARVLLVGGGAQYAESALREKFGNALYVPPDPLLSVARGLYKWAVRDGK